MADNIRKPTYFEAMQIFANAVREIGAEAVIEKVKETSFLYKVGKIVGKIVVKIRCEW